MLVRRLLLKNWRNFKSVNVKLHDITYLLGPNASGKSNFLDVFRFLRDIADPQGGGLQRALSDRGGFSKVRCLAARKKPNIVIEVDLADSETSEKSKWRYYLEIEQETAGKRRPLVVQEVVTDLLTGRVVLQRPDNHDRQDRQLLTQTALEQIAQNGSFRDVSDFFSDVLYLHLVPQLLKFGNEIATKRMINDPFGQGFLEKIASTPEKIQKSRLNRVEEILKKAIGGFDRLEFKQDKAGHPHLQMRFIHWRAKGGFQTEEEFSDGTLRLIALLWTLLESNSMILLEEPELSLHKAIVEQIPELILRARESRKKGPAGQIFVSTHSEALLSSQVVRGQYLTLIPAKTGEGTKVLEPDRQELLSLDCGLTPADVFLPKTNAAFDGRGGL